MGKDTELCLRSWWFYFPRGGGGCRGSSAHPPWSHCALSAVGCVPAGTKAQSQGKTRGSENRILCLPAHLWMLDTSRPLLGWFLPVLIPGCVGLASGLGPWGWRLEPGLFSCWQGRGSSFILTRNVLAHLDQRNLSSVGGAGQREQWEVSGGSTGTVRLEWGFCWQGCGVWGVSGSAGQPWHLPCQWVRASCKSLLKLPQAKPGLGAAWFAVRGYLATAPHSAQAARCHLWAQRPARAVPRAQ